MYVGVDETGETDDAVRRDTVNVRLHWRSTETKEFKGLDARLEHGTDQIRTERKKNVCSYQSVTTKLE